MVFLCADQFVLSKDGYISKTVTLNDALSQPGQIDLQEKMDITLVRLDLNADLGKLYDIKPIYFDLGKYNIRPDAAVEMDKVVSIMKENPTIEIDLGVHTDARGSSASNARLSEKRAKSSVDYFIKQGISKSRLTLKGYGETQLINRCADGIKCTEEEHQQNCRTEFKITKY